jgi:hypothetical protein
VLNWNLPTRVPDQEPQAVPMQSPEVADHAADRRHEQTVGIIIAGALLLGKVMQVIDTATPGLPL